ncbi:MAG: hypothetical protein K9L30_01325 [Desulfobacterales bacterium]|nr:hypothetical protein [Desulfobacterales bacterium]
MTDTTHLSEETIIRSLVDKSDLSPEEEVHLNNCPACLGRAELIENELSTFGMLSQRYVPDQGNVFLSETKGTEKNNFRPVFAMAAAVMLLAIFTWWFTPRTESPEIMSTAQILQEMKEDQQLMAEIDALNTAILSGIYPEDSDDTMSYIDDDFLDFIAPMDIETAI